LKKTICHQLGEFLFLANVCSHSFLNLPSLWMAHNVNVLYWKNCTRVFSLILPPSIFRTFRLSCLRNQKRRRESCSWMRNETAKIQTWHLWMKM
jgi:hypothetical protein